MFPRSTSTRAGNCIKFYESGHMVYAKDTSLKMLHDNVAGFIRRTSNVKE
jgi:carboxypeptidase C (cathepsin A)